MIKLNLLLLFPLLFLLTPVRTFAQLRSQIPADSLTMDLRVVQSSNIQFSGIEHDLLKDDYFTFNSFPEPWLKRFALEFGKSVLDKNHSTFFGDKFRPLSASDFNYSVEYYRQTGNIPYRRTSKAGLFRFN